LKERQIETLIAASDSEKSLPADLKPVSNHPA
jgi:hypothetical protein